MQKILFITANQNKLKEVREILGDKYDVISLSDIGFTEEIPEPFDTIAENSIHKANFFFEKMNLPCISEDSGLEVEALDGKPSAYSARYAGDEKDDKKNIYKVLSEMTSIENRKAKFVSVITYKDAKETESFYGEMKGEIIDKPRGVNGFGYDPIFVANGMNRTNAELTSDEKNKISHRKKALTLLINYFQEKETKLNF